MSNITDRILWKLKNDPLYFIETCLKIRTERKVIPFKLNEVQLKSYAKFKQLRDDNKPIRIMFLKARQTGVSTLTEALIFQDTVMNPNVSSFIIAHDKNSTQHLLNMSKLYYTEMPSYLKPMTRYESKYELVFENPNAKLRAKEPGLRSQIKVETANNLEAGRSFSLQNLHISELAFWDNPEEVMDGLLQSVKDIPGTMIIIESTANGVGDYFYDMWSDAENGRNEFTPIFIPWFELQSYRMEPPEDFEPYSYEHEVYGNEVKIAEQFNLDMDQIYWRRYTIRNKLKNNIRKFQQEYPATPEEAFLVSGRNVFSQEAIRKYFYFVNKLDIRPKRGSLDAYYKFNQGKGNLLLWKEPEKGNRYSIGADTAEGLATGDYSCAQVFDVKNYEQVAEWHGHIEQTEFAYELKKLAKYYNDAIVVVESNQGQVTLDHLKAIYYRLYYRKVMGQRHDKRTRELGFRTTARTKKILVETFKSLFDEYELHINGKDLLMEMKTFVEEEPDPEHKKKVLSVGAKGKNHDDRVIAACLAIQGLKDVPIINEEKKERQRYKPANPLTGY